jgi:hypothetical protein
VSDINNYLLEQFRTLLVACTRLKTKYKLYSYFNISVNGDGFDLINNTGQWPNGYLVDPFYGRLDSDKIYSSEGTASPAAGAPASSGETVNNACPKADDGADKRASVPAANGCLF